MPARSFAGVRWDEVVYEEVGISSVLLWGYWEMYHPEHYKARLRDELSKLKGQG